MLHVLQNVDGLSSISKSKIYNLLKPARSNTAEAARIKDALDIRVGVKACDLSKDNPNAYEYFASVPCIRHMCAELTAECSIFSCHSKTKVNNDGQAVSRYHQLRHFFPNADTPHFQDHDFPVPRYLIEPDGYPLLRPQGDDIKITKNKLGREILDVPATGPLWIYNRCIKNTSLPFWIT